MAKDPKHAATVAELANCSARQSVAKKDTTNHTNRLNQDNVFARPFVYSYSRFSHSVIGPPRLRQKVPRRH